MSNLTIIQNNILLGNYNNKESRMVPLKAAYKDLAPDVVLLQEVDEYWYNTWNLTPELDDIGYAVVPTNGKDKWAHVPDVRNRNPIYYKKDTLTLKECGYDRYKSTEYPGAIRRGNPFEYNSSAYTWALLEEKATGKAFIVISTHLIAVIVHENATEEEKAKPMHEYRNESAQQLADAIKELEAKYNVPVIAMGDYNSRLNTGVYKIMSTDLFSARDTVEGAENMDYNTFNPFGKCPDKGEGIIDHCFYSKFGLDTKHYSVMVTPETWCYSDHVPTKFVFELV